MRTRVATALWLLAASLAVVHGAAAAHGAHGRPAGGGAGAARSRLRMKTEKPSYRKARDFVASIDSAVLPTDSKLSQQGRNLFSKEDAYLTSKEAYTGPTVVLVRPFLPANIGAVARSMLNFGLTDLRIVKPRDDWFTGGSLESASGAREILENAIVYAELEEAVADMHSIYATTVRFRDTNMPEPLMPRDAAAQIAASIGAGQKVCILFGSERNGLSNEEVEVAHELVSIPSNMMFGSLNLSHAVIVLAYEVWLALLALGETRERRAAARAADGRFDSVLPASEAMAGEAVATVAGDSIPATFSETEALFMRLKRGLHGTDKFPQERAASVYPKLHNLLLRLRPSGAEVRLLHGVVRAIFGQTADMLREPESAASGKVAEAIDTATTIAAFDE
ncbi:Alpha/beta knot methyltransferase [Pavlovales sp. CCMP2436]|nr:Alpha/beta knot methyltransferase [Pavlovales sp. CCMP2436]|mmetsp:Transcript_10048/g.25267  ORF Transcript_10048/g.25267 Transcript_10048/m.25267 type:complete len:394 (+) Transcript_10048:163-1344(+)